MEGRRTLAFCASIIILLTFASGQRIRSRCPDIPTMSGFDISEYMGTWYENRRFFAYFELGQKCIQADYQLLDDASVLVENSGILYLINYKVSVVGKATVPDPAVPSKLAVSFYGPTPSEPNYWVIDTDYTSYTLVYSCSDKTFFSTEMAWILVRDRDAELSKEVIDKLYKIFEDNGISTSRFQMSDQKNCGD